MLNKLKCSAYLIIKGEVVIQASYKGWECKFYFSKEKIVYFDIREEGSVFQASLRGGECNLL